MSIWLLILIQFSIIAYGLLAGVFLAFSDFIMRSLAKTSGVGGVEAMREINREVFRWVFMVLFIGMPPVSVFIAVYGGVWIGEQPGMLMTMAGLVYFFGCFAVTVFRNVPMNNALADMDLGLETTKDYWNGTYLPRWTFWNSVRTLACAASALLLLNALL